jgi:hypothetical protein
MADRRKELLMAETNKAKENAADTNTTEYVEYLGEAPYGVTFLTAHTLPKGDALWKRNGVEATKDVVWERDPMGPPVGQKGSRMLVKTEDLPDGAKAVLEKTPGYKIVNE